jgi:glycerophosphoryl diester phosphodiesterase
MIEIIAHRGASGYAPENTFAAFDLACQLAASALETDIRLTRDGVPVLIHDERVDRTTSGTGEVAGYDWNDLSALDAGRWFDPAFAGQHVPRLDEFLDRYANKVRLCIEIKAVEATPAVIACVSQLPKDLDSLEFSSFEWEAVIDLRKAFPDRRVGLLLRQKEVDLSAVHRVAEAGLQVFGPAARAVTPELVAEAHGRGLLVRTWGVKSREDFQHVVACGVDGTTLDCPDWLPRGHPKSESEK